MTRAGATRAALLGAWVLAAACGGSAERADVVAVDGAVADADAAFDVEVDSSADAAVASPDEVCEEIAAAICAPAAACCAAPTAPIESPCRAALVEECRAAGASEISAAQSGKAFISAADLGRCLDAYTAAGQACRTLPAEARLGACRSLFQDPAVVGAVCESGLADLRCAGGSGVCFPEPTGTTCRVYATAGQACAEAICPPWMHCISTGGTLVCDAPRGIDGACEADVHCRDGLRCLNQVCAPGIPAGEACEKSFDCAAELVCDPLEQKCGPPSPQGAACLSALQCADGLTCDGLTIGKVCIPGAETDGSDTPGLPGFLEPCVDQCAKALICGEGPLAGKCTPTICQLLPPGD